MKKSLLLSLLTFTSTLLNGCGSATPLPPPLVATHFSLTAASTPQTAGTAFNIRVTALDNANAVVSTYAGTVHFASTDTQAVLPANSPLTNGTGTFSVILKTATGQAVPTQAIAVNDTAGQLTPGMLSSIVVNAASASQLSVTGPLTANAGAATSFTVTAQDPFGNNATTYSGTLRFTSSDAQAILPANAKLTMGAGSFSVTLKTVGSQTTTATDVATPSITGTANITIPPVSVMVSPPAPTVFLGAMQPFTAKVGGTINTATTWTVQEGAAGGSITNLGVYTAPQVVGTYHVIATSVADSTKNGTAPVTVPPVSVLISPMSVTMASTGTRPFVAAVTGASNTLVAWSVEEGAAGGTVDANGNYVAPTMLGTFHLVATSAADPAKNATATVTVVPSGFFQTGSMTTPRFSHTATLLNTGKALIAGGVASYKVFYRGSQSTCVEVTTDHAELFDPAAGTFASTGSMNSTRANHTSTLLQDGKVLVTGGDGDLGLQLQPGTAEIFDPATATFTATGNMISEHSNHAATLLPSGKVLITGGVSGADISEVFDPALGAFAATGSMSGPRYFHTATLLPNGKVLVVGGLGLMGTVLSTAELYDPAAGTFAPAASMATARRSHTATLLPSGAILIAGGFDQSGTALSTAEIYNPVAGMSAMTGSMKAAHSQHTATLLPSGNVLIAGGGNFIAELFDPGAGTFSVTGSMLLPRILHTATLLPNGQVVVAGSHTSVPQRNSCKGGVDASAELYH
jgi:hypothetical protein